MMTRPLLSLLTTFAMSLLFMLGCTVEPAPEVPPPAVNSVEAESKVLSLLSVNADGTVAITDEAKAEELIGRAWPAAKSDLASLNRRIRSGQVKGFKSVADLAGYSRSQPNYLMSLSNTGEINYTAASDPPDPKNPQCRAKCPASELCCCSGWWIFCWNVCGCTP